MKCVMDSKTGKISRVSNQKAEWMVQSGKWFYARKEDWKLGGRLR